MGIALAASRANWPAAFGLVLGALRRAGCGVQICGDRARATCPGHRDARPSLVVTSRNDRVLVKCFAGCRTSDVLRALGLQFADLFDAHAPRVRPMIAAQYPYTDLHGAVLAEKVRFEPKAFRWRRPDATARSGWRWGLEGVTLPLYRLPELRGQSTVLLTEGEKAVDALVTRGFAATCPPAGASTWQDRWTGQLVDEALCERLVILPDNDREGGAHARRVATACADWLRVSFVTLPKLPPKGDVVDFFEIGGTADDLRRLVDRSPDWTPGTDEQDRQRHRRELARERKRRQRARQREALAGHAVNVRGAA